MQSSLHAVDCVGSRVGGNGSSGCKDGHEVYIFMWCKLLPYDDTFMDWNQLCQISWEIQFDFKCEYGISRNLILILEPNVKIFIFPDRLPQNLYSHTEFILGSL